MGCGFPVPSWNMIRYFSCQCTGILFGALCMMQHFKVSYALARSARTTLTSACVILQRSPWWQRFFRKSMHNLDGFPLRRVDVAVGCMDSYGISNLVLMGSLTATVLGE